MRVLLLCVALGLAGCVDTFARRDDAKCRDMGAQRGVCRQSISDSWLGNLRECLAHLV